MANDARKSVRPKRTAKVMATLLVAFSFLSIALFQNCSPASQEGVEENFGGKSGNGDIYSGFRFVELVRTGLCSDGTNVNAVIYVNESRQLLLERDNCADIEPRVLSSSQARIDDGLVFYEGRVFEPKTESTTNPNPTPAPVGTIAGLRCQSIASLQPERCPLDKSSSITLDLDQRTSSGFLAGYVDCVSGTMYNSPVSVGGSWQGIQLEGFTTNDVNAPIKFKLTASQPDLRGQLAITHQGQTSNYVVTCTNR